jgi:cytochrome c biogenesis protein CcmG/thiol:disulfide interchange protein DsbE
MNATGIARRRLMLLAPLGVAAAGGLAFWSMLDRMQEGKFDPHDIGNPMLGHHIPDFDLPGLPNSQGFSSKDLIQAAQAQPVLLNFFSSWCIPCASEAGVLDELQKLGGVPIWGIAYKDAPEKTQKFLDQYGNPYARIASDSTGDVFINFGLYGVPENYIIDRRGMIAWHIAGPLSDDVIEQQMLPAIAKAKA